jgi:hypothetical protein
VGGQLDGGRRQVSHAGYGAAGEGEDSGGRGIQRAADHRAQFGGVPGVGQPDLTDQYPVGVFVRDRAPGPVDVVHVVAVGVGRRVARGCLRERWVLGQQRGGVDPDAVRAVALLVNQIENVAVYPEELLFEPELVVRGSTGRPAPGAGVGALPLFCTQSALLLESASGGRVVTASGGLTAAWICGMCKSCDPVQAGAMPTVKWG